MHLKRLLLLGVSSIALAALAPAARAADLADTSVPVAATLPALTVFIEGGVNWASGDRLYPNTPLPDFFSPFAGAGGEVAAGLDYRFNDTWHASASFRYGWSRRNKHHDSSETVTFARPPGDGTSGPNRSFDTTGAPAGTVHVRSSHLVADFAVGRDMGIGSGDAQVKLGLRYADLSEKISGPGAAYIGSDLTSLNSTSDAYLKSRFQGLGPRVAVEGSMPISGQWGVDYGAGAAYLFALKRDRTFAVESGDMITQSDKKGVFNLDASLALTYNFTSTTKVAVGYRADAYFDALPGIDFTKVGGGADSTRVYHGAFLRLTTAF
ncbi:MULTISPECIES: Lpg1974 family pore-forming outer membrane protein [unclassified Mesorhizobium]|uniref:Lpg1974 family pore-forming outer membrane protein n=1 Tax=unclassified Mesorhizobium TaxID=325217 RepID=UPI0018D4377C|nr:MULTISPECIES: Lpg1974 family pore-forming outer membrane protein [unclassified Mesorhizobium]MDG4855152.1 Lpg1974 family pore-forming outer membrane protein [Mesorhizobium sp. WSM4982]MDG4913722.1 Lpg1974 family pore-forming outer membrane protein [Mesorhizobium sp. WSM4983]